ncbi:MAG TPA: FAD:protein FMN transferase [Roseimicrobium sp.]|nr:FAD:protein FMN transferase [Roseimicrobium sp.]
MQTVAVARIAMATRFEIVLIGDDPVRLRAAGEEALQEIERLDAQLSFYRPDSEITHINQRAAAGPVRVEPRLFHLLLKAKCWSHETGGAFDISVAPLLRAWGFVGGTGSLPDPAVLAEARACTGMHLVDLDEDNFTVRFHREGVLLDLGSLGKGWALEQAVEILREAGIDRALLHGGTSTVCAIGAPPGAEHWSIAIDDPARQSEPGAWSVGSDRRRQPWVTVDLKDEALSVSGIRGKAFEVDGRILGHVLDPKTGEPAQGALLSAVVLPSAAETDVFSTALLVGGLERCDALTALRPGMRSLVVGVPQNGLPGGVVSNGIALSGRA